MHVSRPTKLKHDEVSMVCVAQASRDGGQDVVADACFRPCAVLGLRQRARIDGRLRIVGLVVVSELIAKSRCINVDIFTLFCPRRCADLMKA